LDSIVRWDQLFRYDISVCMNDEYFVHNTYFDASENIVLCDFEFLNCRP